MCCGLEKRHSLRIVTCFVDIKHRPTYYFIDILNGYYAIHLCIMNNDYAVGLYKLNSSTI